MVDFCHGMAQMTGEPYLNPPKVLMGLTSLSTDSENTTATKDGHGHPPKPSMAGVHCGTTGSPIIASHHRPVKQKAHLADKGAAPSNGAPGSVGFYGQKHAFDHGRHRQQDGFYGIFMGLSENEIPPKKNTPTSSH